MAHSSVLTNTYTHITTQHAQELDFLFIVVRLMSAVAPRRTILDVHDEMLTHQHSQT